MRVNELQNLFSCNGKTEKELNMLKYPGEEEIAKTNLDPIYFKRRRDEINRRERPQTRPEGGTGLFGIHWLCQQEFCDIVEKFYNRKIFEKVDGEWKLKKPRFSLKSEKNGKKR